MHLVFNERTKLTGVLVQYACGGAMVALVLGCFVLMPRE
jgi:hypothetical protein